MRQVKQTIHRRSRKANRGQGLVEFALVLPVMLFMLLGIIDFARVMVIYSGISNGAREAVRYGAVPGRHGDGSRNYQDCAQMRALIDEAVPLMSVPDDDIKIGFDHGSGAPTNYYAMCGEVNPNDVQQGDRIYADVNARVALVTPIINNIWPELTVRFVAARTIVKEGTLTEGRLPNDNTPPPGGEPTEVKPTDTPGVEPTIPIDLPPGDKTATTVSENKTATTVRGATQTAVWREKPVCTTNCVCCRGTKTAWVQTATAVMRQP